MNIKKGQIIQTKGGQDRKVLEVVGDLYAISFVGDFESLSAWYSLKELKEHLILPEPTWQPEEESSVWVIYPRGVGDLWWKSGSILADYPLGVYRTREKAEAKLERCKKA